MIIFEYPSELETEQIEKDFKSKRQGVLSADKKSLYLIIGAILSLILSLATTDALSNALYIVFVILIFVAYLLRKFPKKLSKYVFITAYNDRIHIIAYDYDLVSRTEINALYDDVIKFKFKKNKLKMLIYETENSYVLRYNSEGKIIEKKTTFSCDIPKESEIEHFFVETAPVLFN